MSTIDEWLAFGGRLYANGVDVFNNSEVMERARPGHAIRRWWP
jgi:hypothetical protein